LGVGIKKPTPFGFMATLAGVISYPIPLYSNVPIESQYFQPSRFVISAVTLGYTTTVTTSIPHNYVIGQECRLNIPRSFGCFQLNQATGFVLSIPSTTQVELSINSSKNVNNYIASSATTVAQIVAIGDINTGVVNNSGNMSTSTLIPGSFENISPL
jgi:hypothetical protein